MTDYRRAFDSLGPDDREAVERFLASQGFVLEELEHCPPARQYVAHLATAELAKRMPKGASDDDRYRAAAGKLGLSGSSLLRSLQRWHRAARAATTNCRPDPAYDSHSTQREECTP